MKFQIATILWLSLSQLFDFLGILLCYGWQSFEMSCWLAAWSSAYSHWLDLSDFKAVGFDYPFKRDAQRSWIQSKNSKHCLVLKSPAPTNHLQTFPRTTFWDLHSFSLPNCINWHFSYGIRHHYWYVLTLYDLNLGPCCVHYWMPHLNFAAKSNFAIPSYLNSKFT